MSHHDADSPSENSTTTPCKVIKCESDPNCPPVDGDLRPSACLGEPIEGDEVGGYDCPCSARFYVQGWSVKRICRDLTFIRCATRCARSSGLTRRPSPVSASGSRCRRSDPGRTSPRVGPCPAGFAETNWRRPRGKSRKPLGRHCLPLSRRRTPMAALGPNRDEEHCNGSGASAVAQAGSHQHRAAVAAS